MKYFLAIVILVSTVGLIYSNSFKNNSNLENFPAVSSTIKTNISKASPIPLNIEYMRSQNYPGSEIETIKKLEDGINYKRYIVSFYSDGLKQYSYLTIPNILKPSNGFPVIIFIHGYQIPNLYTPEGNYVDYMDAFAKNGYVVFKPDLRGNGNSQGVPGSSYFSPNYTVDILNAISSIKTLKDSLTVAPLVNPNKIGIWGHSMGGHLTLKVAEISRDIKAAVIWGGVVGSLNDIIYNWQDKVSYKPAKLDLHLRNLGLNELLKFNKSPSENPTFWNSIDPTKNVNFINFPVQIHVGLSDNQVPPKFSEYLFIELQKSNKTVEYYAYPGANHDINQSFTEAIQKSINFFDRHLK